MLFARTYKLKSSGSKRLNIGLAPNSNFTCKVEIEDLHHHSAVKLRVNDAEQFDSVLESVLFKMAKPVRHHHEEEKEFNILGCVSKIATLKNGRVILMIKSPESGLCVYLSESAVSKLGDLRFALYNFSSKLLHWRSLVRSYYDIVVKYISEHKSSERQLSVCIFVSLYNCAELNDATELCLNDIRAEFYAHDKQLFSEYCIAM